MQIRWLNPFDYFDNIYYINLDRRTDRLEQCWEEFSKHSISGVERISGVEHSNPAVGCHLSHAKIFADALESGYDRILIFEDDVEFFPNAVHNLQTALRELPPNWEMFYLGANLDAYPAYEIYPHIARLTGAYATHAYAVRRPLFRKLYAINADEGTHHNDVTYANEIHPQHECYLAMPLIAGQRESYSDIQGITMSSNQVFLTRLQKNLVRMER